MRATVIDCAGCGAPLGGAIARMAAGGHVPCLYCGALLRIAADESTVVERRLSADVMARAREAALRGGRAEALALVVREAGIDEASAAAAVDDLIKSVAHQTVFAQTLSPVGWTIVLGSVSLVLGGITVLVWPSPARLFGLAFLAFGLLNLAVLGRGVATSLRFWRASRGVAAIRRSIDVGPTGMSDGCRIFSLSVDVTPDDGKSAPFHARLVVPVRPLTVANVAEGKRIAVRFEPDGAWLRSDPDRKLA